MPRSANPVSPASSLAPSPRNFFVGTSGWAYPTWKPEFYPQPVPARLFLPFYAARLTSVEVNYTFRTLPSVTQLESWLAAVPPGFRFSFKAPQRITHFARLRDCETPMEELLQVLQPVAAAGKLGPLLLQLPPNFVRNEDRLRDFFAMPCLCGPHAPRLAIEFRHESWFQDSVFELLRSANVALCVAESEDLTTPDVETADFRYYRMRCPGGYSTPKLKRLAKACVSHAAKSELFVYLKHEDEPTGALNAAALLAFANQANRKPKAAR